ncbi:MAG TPA: VOC family protein [Glycomyces sp.]|nr:VOC family protein [Glycomyces sp.]
MEHIAPEITKDIYPMPAFATIAAADIDATVDWYTEGLGFLSLFVMPGPDGTPVVVHLRRWRYQDLLVKPGGAPASGASGPELSMMAEADELDALAERARAHGGGSVEGPYDTPWNTRDVKTVDPDGHALVFTARRAEGQHDEGFDREIRRLAGEQGLHGTDGRV